MFNGIINHTGRFKGYRRGKFEIAVDAPSISSRIEIGESVSVNGVCLSLVRKEKDTLFFNLAQETIQKTNLGLLRQGQKINLELPLTLSSLLSGHLITGHIDSPGKVLKITDVKPGKRLTISFPSELKKYLIRKGSIAINGISLTIASLTPTSLDVELIPITLKNSNMSELRRGDLVNLECDIIGKYVYNWASEGKQ